MPNIQTFPTVADLHAVVADAFCELVTQTLASRATFRVSLSGGSTPKRLYEILSTRDLPWDRIHWFWGDERNVGPDHDDSNQRMVRTAMLSPAGVPESNIHAVPVDVNDPDLAAETYEATLRKMFPDDPFPVWDLCLLGMGDDAHTASLFPETAALAETDRWFVANWVRKFDAYRYTLTAPAINSARQAWFLVSGENKRVALSQIWGSTRDVNQYPSQLINSPTWYVTSEAMPPS